MTDAPTTPTTDPAASAQEPQGAAPTPSDAPAQPDTTDWKAEARKWEDRAKANKGAAEQLAALEEASKTEAEKVADRLKAAEVEAAEARREASRYKIASEFRLSVDDAAALEHVASEDGMRLIAQRLAAAVADQKKQGNFVPREGNSPSAVESDERATTRALFNNGG